MIFFLIGVSNVSKLVHDDHGLLVWILKPWLVVFSRLSERMTEPRLAERTYLRTLWEKQLMHGKGSLSSVLMVSLLFFVLFVFGLLCWTALPITSKCTILYRVVICILTEKEAAKLRSFVDEPAFTDLHWVWFNFAPWFHLYLSFLFLLLEEICRRPNKKESGQIGLLICFC